jgi:hypothetical protein
MSLDPLYAFNGETGAGGIGEELCEAREEPGGGRGMDMAASRLEDKGEEDGWSD